MPVGIAISAVVIIIGMRIQSCMPLTNMWCAQTVNPRTTIARREKPQAVIALGCVIKGETPQYAAIGQAVADGLMQVALMTEIPVTCGVIVADSLAQAKARAGGRVGNRGAEAALAALAMVDLVQARV